MKISDIKIPKRIRQDMGDIPKLAASIQEIGLLHPPVVDENGELLVGQRRIKAVEALGWTEIPVRIAKNLSDAVGMLKAERDENVCRENFTIPEAVALGGRLEKLLKPEAKKRQSEAGKKRGRGKTIGCGNLPQAMNGKTRDAIGAAIGMSGKTYEAAKAVVNTIKSNKALLPILKVLKSKGVNAAKKAIRNIDIANARSAMAAKADSIKPSDRWSVHLADMRTWSTDRLFEFIITDPPYPKEFLPLYADLGRRAKEWLTDGGLLIAMCGQSYVSEIYAALCEHLTYYWTACYLLPGQPTPLRQVNVNSSWKPLLLFSKGKYKGKIFGDVFKSESEDKDFHQWGQSVSGMLDIISGIVLPGQSILDPFCGAGTTGVAAIKHGCTFEGVEIEEQTQKIAISRIGQA